MEQGEFKASNEIAPTLDDISSQKGTPSKECVYRENEKSDEQQAFGEDHPLSKRWAQIEPKVAVCVTRHLPVATLTLMRRRVQGRTTEDAWELVIGAPSGTQQVWAEVRKECLRLLDELSVSNEEVTIVALGNYCSQDETKRVKLTMDSFKHDVHMGASFGLKSENLSATIGGQIMLQNAAGTYRRFLTAFHPFRDSISRRLQQEGRQPKFTNKFKIGPVVMPSEQDTQYTLAAKQEQIADIFRKIEEKQNLSASPRRVDIDSDEQQQLQKIEQDCKELCAFTEDQIAGHLWSSGKFDIVARGAEMLTALDWALIEPQDGRLVANTVPDEKEISAKVLKRIQYEPECGTVESWSMENVEADAFVIKRGRTTGVTVGQLAEKETVVLPGVSTTYEAWSVRSPFWSDSPFCRSGDS